MSTVGQYLTTTNNYTATQQKKNKYRRWNIRKLWHYFQNDNFTLWTRITYISEEFFIIIFLAHFCIPCCTTRYEFGWLELSLYVWMNLAYCQFFLKWPEILTLDCFSPKLFLNSFKNNNHIYFGRIN